METPESCSDAGSSLPEISSEERQKELPSSSTGTADKKLSILDWHEPAVDGVNPDIMIERLEQGVLSLQDALLELIPDCPMPQCGFTDAFCFAMLESFFNTPVIRKKLPQYNTFEDALELFRRSKKILVLTGAGVSVSCGIPDFRSKNGIYARLHVDFPDLPDPTAMFDIRYFEHNPQPFYTFAKEIFMGQFEPSLSHKFIRELEAQGKLQRNYTQNIDTLEKQTGIERVIECHGSFAKATCRQCQAKFDGEVIREDVMAQRVARCPHCQTGVIKPDITFFGEDLPQEFHRTILLDRDAVDLVVVIGSSLKVGPVNSIPTAIAKDVPQILINREPLEHYNPDVTLLGNCDDIIREICYGLGASFEKLVHDHDEKKRQLNPEYRCIEKPRKKIDHDDFVKMMLDGEITDNGESDSERSDEDGQPERKRRRLEPSFRKRFIRVQKKFPLNGYYFQTDPSTAIFFGSYVYYDTLKKKLTGSPSDDKPQNNIFPSLDFVDGPSNDLEETRGGSVPPDITGRESESPPIRASSCEPTVDVDALIPSEDILRVLEDDSESDSSYGDPGYASSGGESPQHEVSPQSPKKEPEED